MSIRLAICWCGSLMRLANIKEILQNRQSKRSPLGQLIDRADRQQAWTNQLRALLPAEEAIRYRVANISDGRLTIHAESASWATRLRFQGPELLSALRQLEDFAHVREIRVRTAGARR